MRFEDILLHIGNDEEPLNLKYLYGLSGINQQDLAAFKEAWPSVSARRRRSVIRQLVELTENSFEVNFDPVFLLTMADEDGEVRAAAIEGLWENEDCALIEPLVYLLRTDEAAIVRAAAASALGRFVLLGELEKIEHARRMAAEQALRETSHLKGESVEVRRRAVESIAYSGRKGVRTIIQEAYHSDDEAMQASAVFAMGRSADPHWRREVSMELDNPNPQIRYEAARACGELEISKVVSQLGDMAFNDPDREVQQAAVWALGCIGGKKAREILQAAYESEDENLSLSASEALDQIDLLDESLSIPLYDDWEENDEEDSLD